MGMLQIRVSIIAIMEGFFSLLEVQNNVEKSVCMCFTD